ncbi:hypothetical protein E1B28_009599 [Marasmius oreades]|uniref:Uncharacterized protein n=1 Tax=Marasmius oreades TaxID=181124 RepID=A0A9P7UQW7_9AGAR|nr:uncharacterized protein E1B28_009599 [Marasmius oreades]KAG7090485.1 hypothetical protein E1B28_009599 [Marasmius oreades]
MRQVIDSRLNQTASIPNSKSLALFLNHRLFSVHPSYSSTLEIPYILILLCFEARSTPTRPKFHRVEGKLESTIFFRALETLFLALSDQILGVICRLQPMICPVSSKGWEPLGTSTYHDGGEVPEEASCIHSELGHEPLP